MKQRFTPNFGKMVNKNKLPQSNVQVVQEFEMYGNKNIQIYTDEQRGMVLLKIYGEILTPENYVSELHRLEQLSKEYRVIEVTLNSPGGATDTEMDLLSIFDLYSYVITIGKGEVGSAAFTLWSRGDIRVTTNHCLYMAHRESYTMAGKTREHVDTAKVFNEVFEEMFDTYAHSLMTPEEIKRAEHTEVWLTYKDMLERKIAISYEEYLNPTNAYATSEFFVTKEGINVFYNPETETYMSAKIEWTDELEFEDTIQYLYDLPEMTEIDMMNSEEETKMVTQVTNKEPSKTMVVEEMAETITEVKPVKKAKKTTIVEE